MKGNVNMLKQVGKTKENLYNLDKLTVVNYKIPKDFTSYFVLYKFNLLKRKEVKF